MSPPCPNCRARGMTTEAALKHVRDCGFINNVGHYVCDGCGRAFTDPPPPPPPAMEYTVVGHMHLEPFVEKVNQKIAEGWKPQGGIDTAADRFLQAMVRRPARE